MHVHSTFSVDGKDNLMGMCQAAIEKGLGYICFTEHFDMNPKDYGYGYFDFEEFSKAVDSARSQFVDRLCILKGLEFNEPHLYPVEFENILKKDLDVVLGAVHWLGEFLISDKELQERFKKEEIFEKYYTEVLKTTKFGGFDILAHLDSPKRYLKQPYNERSLIDEILGELVGLDISGGMLAKARAKVTDAVLVEGDASSMPFSGESFDAAYCIQVFHHISDKTKFLQEVHRILRSKARFVIQICSHEQLATFVASHYFPEGFEFERKRFPRIEEISALFAKVGFSDIDVHPCPFDGLSTESPEAYLDKRYRDGLSTFSYLRPRDIEQGCDKIRQDLVSGEAIKVVETLRETIERISGQVTFIRSVKC